jgi:hypothetical protein
MGRNLPPLGDEGAPDRKCSRTINGIVGPGEVLCGKVPIAHLDWGEAGGYVCENHFNEAVTRWQPQAYHALGANCGMPGTVWWQNEDGTSLCIYEDGLPTAEPVRAVSVEVPA